MENKALIELNGFEDELIKSFGEQAFFQKLNQLSWAEINHVLLQRRFISHIFTPIYDLIIDGLSDAEAKKIVRVLIREEYPDSQGNMPSHREDLIYDLENLGIEKTEILASRPSPQTTQFITDSLEFVYKLSNEKNESLRNLGLLLMVRFWGEILISVEYKLLWSRLSERLNKKNSRFYYQHYIHDQKKKGLDDLQTTLQSHADRTSILIIKYIENNQDGFDFFKSTEKSLFDLKNSFYTQF